MKIGRNDTQKSFEMFATKEVMKDFVNQFKEEKINVPEIVLLLFEPSISEIMALELIGVKTILHSPSHKEVEDAQCSLLAGLLDECEKSISETLQQIEIDVHHRYEELSDTLYNKIYLYDGYIPPIL